MSEKKQNPDSQSISKPSLERAQMQDARMQDVHAQLMREKNEPREGFSPIPIFLLFIFSGLCFWGGVYLVKNSGDFRWDVYSPDFDPDADVPPPVQLTLIERGQKIYNSQCVACHQATGQGIAGVYPPLADSEWVDGHPEVVSRILINGLNGPIEVKGKTYNGNMPAFGPNGLNLKPVEIAAVITYIRQEWGNEASEVTEATVSGYMAAYSGRSTPWKAEELREGLGPEPVVEEAPAAETGTDDAEPAAGEAPQDADSEEMPEASAEVESV